MIPANGAVEIVLDRAFLATRDDEQVRRRGGNGFFHVPRDCGLVHDWQHRSRLLLREREETAAQACRGDDRFHGLASSLTSSKTHRGSFRSGRGGTIANEERDGPKASAAVSCSHTPPRTRTLCRARPIILQPIGCKILKPSDRRPSICLTR